MAKVKDTEWNKIVYGNGVYVAVGNNAIDSNAAYSTDGINWIPVNTTVYNIRSLCYGNGKFIAWAMGIHENASNSDGFLGSSVDGKKWNFTKLGYYVDGRKSDIIFAENKFVACGRNKLVEYSTDGINWNSVIVVDYSISYSKIVYGDGIYACFELKNTQVRYSMSSTGLNGDWNPGNLKSEHSISYLTDIVFDGEKFVLLCGDDIYTSTDLKTFTKVVSFDFGRMSALSYKNGLYVAVGMNDSNDNAYLAYSFDLTNWISMNPIIDSENITITDSINTVLLA